MFLWSGGKLSEGIFSRCMREVYCYSDPFVLCVICTCKNQLKGYVPLVKWSHQALCLWPRIVLCCSEQRGRTKRKTDSGFISRLFNGEMRAHSKATWLRFLHIIITALTYIRCIQQCLVLSDLIKPVLAAAHKFLVKEDDVRWHGLLRLYWRTFKRNVYE
jgi:hypothetical protein